MTALCGWPPWSVCACDILLEDICLVVEGGGWNGSGDTWSDGIAGVQ